MYLKSIEIHGFKSFANKQVFVFHNGITGIVGPNGSGKSNVADAVRWVLGEQSAKQLRGSNMQDVIFSGTELRKPQSYAYVALTISNEDHKLDLPYEEVKVARRVYRSGESEYLLNGASCRLKDIQELFFDTGIGKEGYSIIGQGQIDKILSGKPEDRRELFDEAAGIVKFKKRKAAAEKNLDVESQNLLRIKDILAELEKQVGPLEEQSDKAKQYLRLKEELKRYEVGLFCMDYESLNDEIHEIDTNLSHTQSELKEAKEEKERSRSRYDEIEEKINKYDRSIESKKEEVNKDRLSINNFESEIRITKEKIASVVSGKEYYKKRLDEIDMSESQAKAELSEYKDDERETNDRLDEIKHKEETITVQLDSLEKDILEKEIRLNELNDSVIDYMNTSGQITLDQQKAKSMLEQNNIKKAELNQKVLTNKTCLSSAQEEMDKEESLYSDAKKALDNEYVAKKTLIREAENKQEEIKDLQNEQQENQKQYHTINSKLETLKNMAERYDGYGQSIRRVMEQKKSNKGILGVVADIIQVDEAYITAIETALGGNIQNIVTEDENVAKQMIQFLKKNRFGRATFLPLTTVKANDHDFFKDDVLSEKGVLGDASSVVTRDAKYDSIIEYLLGRFLLVDTIDHAMAISRKYHYKFRIVTLEGEMFSPGGSLSGGAFKNSSNLLGRRKEIDTLKESVKEVSANIQTCKDRIAQAQTEEEKLRSDADKKDDILKDLELKMNTAKIKYDQAVSQKNQIEQEYLEIQKSGKEIESEKKRLSDSLTQIDNDLKISKQKQEETKESIALLSKELDKARDHQIDIQDKATDIRLEASSYQQKASYIAENLHRIEANLQDMATEKARLVGEQDNSDATAKQMEDEILKYQRRCEELADKVETLLLDIDKESKKKDEMMNSQKDFFEERDALISHISELDKESFRLESRKQHIGEKIEEKTNHIWNEYELTYHNAKELVIDEQLSYTRMKANVGETKTKIRDLGDVNVNAIEEFKTVSERYDLLKTQHDDLVESEQALKKIISDLDEEMRKQFAEKFADIKKQFDKVFKELFGGGKGTLELVEDEDVLEAGITINAQPPGKKLGNMMQLSGGEKALTAIALLFAIQNLKPSPFCLLDEIEAALDDSNVKRYAKYLHKLTKNTQFIVITHRKGTMEAADVLYGITMQEKGVSTMVSVKLIEEQLED